MAKLINIRINNIKNVQNGVVSFVDQLGIPVNVTGIYGQNGSGKTALIDAVALIRDLVKYRTVPIDGALLSNTEDNHIEVVFDDEEKQQFIKYSVCLRNVGDQPNIISEELKIKNKRPHNSFKSYYIYDAKNSILKVRTKNLPNSLRVMADVTYGDCHSFMVSKQFLTWLDKGEKTTEPLKDALNGILTFVSIILNVHVVSDVIANLSSIFLPMTFVNHDIMDIPTSGVVSVGTQDPLTQSQFDKFKKAAYKVNKVLPDIIPGVELDYRNTERISDNGDEKEYVVELFTLRSGKRVPYRMESVGIRKIISVLSFLIEVYNNENAIVLIDEFDAGIYEYLLGEIVDILDNDADGQLIFTSHNLRILETLSPRNIIFTTVDNSNRYTRFESLKPTNSLRKRYLAETAVNESKYYESTNKAKIIEDLITANIPEDSAGNETSVSKFFQKKNGGK